MLETTIGRAAGGNAWRRLGKIKLGIQVPAGEGKTRPKDLEYFVIPDAPGAAPNRYRDALGDKPQQIDIVLANSKFSDNFDSRAVMYRANNSRACHTSDDRTAQRYMKPPGEDSFRWVSMECPNLQCEFRIKKQCKERGYFSFMIPATGEVGTFSLIMGTRVGITQVYNTLKMVEELCEGRPKGMAGIRLKLRRERKEFFQDLRNDGNLSKIVKFIPMVEIDFAHLLHDDQRRLGPLFGQPILLPTTASPDHFDDHEDIEEGGES